MRRPSSLWLLGGLVWLASLGALRVCMPLLRDHPVFSAQLDGSDLGLLAFLPAGLVVMAVREGRARPASELRAGLWAIVHASPGTIGAVVITRNGVPKVIATVRSTEEYLQLAGSGRLPQDHHVYLPSEA